MATKLGTLAYTGTNPIGGGAGYASPHGYTEAGANYVVRTASALSAALKLATAQQVIWLAADITCPSVASLGTLKSKAAMASDGHTISQPYTTSTFMAPVIWGETNAIFSGVNFKGPGGMVGMNGPGNCAIRGISGAKRIEVENVEISQFPCGGVYFYGGGMIWNDDGPNGRHWVHHSYIHHIQKHGYGYGISQEGPCSYLAEACRFDRCRHEVMAQAESTGLEVRYCSFGDGVYSATYASHQVDSHGSDSAATSPSACKHMSVHHNDFSLNETNEVKPNVCIRGVPTYGAEIFANRTRKLHNGQAGVFSETMPNGAFTVWGGATGTLASYNVKVFDNQYGPWDETPEDPPDDEPPLDTNAPDIQVVSLEAPAAAVGDTYTIKATVTNVGTGPGSADIIIGYLAGSTKRPLLTQPVELEAGETKAVEHKGMATRVGGWTFYCGDKTVVLQVLAALPSLTVSTEVIRYGGGE